MEELLKKAEELQIKVKEETTEEELKELIEKKEKELKESNKKDENKSASNGNSNKKDENKNNIRVIDNDNKPINNEIANDPKEIPKIKHRKELHQAENGEYYEEIGNGNGMWSRTGEIFTIKDLK